MSDVEIEPDTKDWTWVLTTPCEECGFDPATVTRAELAGRIAAAAAPWPERLSRPDARERPQPSTWSATEYGAHVRDCAGVMAERLRLILTEDDPRFANWDQDEAAVAGNYARADPGEVAEQASSAVAGLASGYETVGDEQWDRPGLRSNGSVFTAFTLGVYALHDFEHHLHDVGVRPDRG